MQWFLQYQCGLRRISPPAQGSGQEQPRQTLYASWKRPCGTQENPHPAAQLIGEFYPLRDNIRPLAGEVFQGSDKDGIYGITSKHLEQIELGDPFGISAVILDFSDLQVFHAPRLERINDHNINT